MYFAWEDQSDAAYHIVHIVLISCITVLYESYRTVMQLISTVMHLIGQIQYSYVENLFKECMKTIRCKSLKPAKLILPVRSMARNRLYKHLLIV